MSQVSKFREQTGIRLEWPIPRILDEEFTDTQRYQALLAMVVFRRLLRCEPQGDFVYDDLQIDQMRWLVPDRVLELHAHVILHLRGLFPLPAFQDWYGMFRMEDHTLLTSWIYQSRPYPYPVWRSWFSAGVPDTSWWDIQGPILWVGFPDPGSEDVDLSRMGQDLPSASSALEHLVNRMVTVTWDQNRGLLLTDRYPSITIPTMIRRLKAYWPYTAPIYRAHDPVDADPLTLAD